jgi:enoyl-CoA hydratase
MSASEGAAMNDAVLTQRRDEVLLITLNRPEARNAINGAVARGLLDAVTLLDDDPGLRVGVLTGAGQGFSSGMDLKAFVQGEDIAPLATFVQRGATKPLIAAVEGFALAGGLELALSCDLIVAAAGARFGIPEVTVGLFAAGGGVFRLRARVGYGKAMEMAITGDPIEAQEAAGLGLVTQVTDPGSAVDTALRLAQRVAKNAPLAVATSKELVKASQGLTEAEFWAVQQRHNATIFNSGDAREGARAFAEKRPPEWSGT